LSTNSKIKFSPIVTGILVGVSILCLGIIIAYMRYQILIQYQQEETQKVLALIEQNIENTIQESYSVALTLALTVDKEGEVEDFEKIAEQILSNNDHVDVLELVPKGIIQYVYPLEGNESVIGYDILSDPNVNAEVIKAAESGTIYFAGPIDLKQGGKAVIGRLPIMINDKMWGFSAVLIYLETLIKKSGINNFSNEKYYFQLSKINPNTNEEEFFLPVDIAVSPDAFESISFPEGDWKLYGKKLDNDLADSSFFVILILSIFGALLFGFMTSKLMRKPEELQIMLKEKSEKLLSSRELFKKNSELLQSILESPKGVIIFSLDADYNYLAFTVSHKELMKKIWNQEIEVGKSMLDYVPDEEIKQSLKSDFDRALKGEYFEYVRKYGNENFPGQYWENRFAPINTKDGQAVGLTAFITNITQRVKAEKEITLEKQLSDSVINNLPGIFYLYNKEGEFYRWNENFEKVSGYTSEEMEKAHPLNFFDDDEKELLTKKIGNVFISGEDNVEAHFMKKDGAKIPYYFTGAAINYKGEECLLGVGIDISEQKKVEKEINFEKSLSDAIINSLPGVFYLFNKEGKYLRWNDNLEEISNYTGQEIETAHPLDFFAQDEKELLKEKIGNVFITGADNVEAHLLTKEGDKIPYYFTGASMNYKGEECLLGVGVDISEQKKAEQKHEEVLQQLQNHLYNSPLGVVEYDSDLNIISWSKRCEEIFGWTEQEILHKNAFDIIYNEDKVKTEVVARELSSGSVDSNISNNRNYTKSGEIIDCIWYNSVVKNASGEILTVMSLVEDITEKKKIEEIVKQNEKRYRTLITNSPFCIHELDLDQRILSMNRSGLDMMCIDKEDDILGTVYSTLVKKEDNNRISELFGKALKGESSEFEFEVNQGTYFLSSFIPILDEKNEVQRVMGITQDITERKRSEEIIENSLREKTTLLSEIHHRVKNNLAIVSGLLQLQKNEVKDEMVNTAFEQSINRIISIAMVHELMYKSPDLSSVNVHSYLEMLIPAISASMQDESKNINFEIDIQEYNLNISEAIPLGLLLNELITNSFKYAFDGNEKGNIKIELSAKENEITILYGDNGKGFDESKDFNTPKNLGLNLIHAQLQQLDAEYEVDTNSKFRLEFKFKAQPVGDTHT